VLYNALIITISQDYYIPPLGVYTSSVYKWCNYKMVQRNTVVQLRDQFPQNKHTDTWHQVLKQTRQCVPIYYCMCVCLFKSSSPITPCPLSADITSLAYYSHCYWGAPPCTATTFQGSGNYITATSDIAFQFQLMLLCTRARHKSGLQCRVQSFVLQTDRGNCLR
jgi:hypothetical protein